MRTKEQQKEDFFDWLDSCPVTWLLLTSDDDSRDYTFIFSEVEE